MANVAVNHAQISFGLRFAETLKTIADRMIQRHTYRVTLRELSSLSAREMADLGMNPANIHQIAYEAAYGANA